MGATIAEIQGWLTAAEISYLPIPGSPYLMIGVRLGGEPTMILVEVAHGGELVQLRSRDMLTCPDDHVHAGVVDRLLAAANVRYWLAKWGRDTDGEIVAYCDLLVADAILTRGQFFAALKVFFSNIEVVCGRLRCVMRLGYDPGEQDLRTVGWIEQTVVKA